MLKRIVFSLFGFILSLTACFLSVQATTLGFQTSSFASDEISTFLQDRHFEKVADDSYQAGIQCFDISIDGNIAIAAGESSNCRVYVYDQNRTFLFGLKFRSDGDFGVEYLESNLVIYFLRGNTVAIVDPTGELVDVQKITSPEQNYEHIIEILNRTSKQSNNKCYMLERDIGIGDSFSRLVAIDEYGERTILYNTSTGHMLSQIVLIISIISLFFLAVWGIYKKQKREDEADS